MTETRIYEDDQVIVWEEVTGTPGTPDHVISQRTEPKPGTPDYNRATLEARGLTALTANRAFLDLATPTNAQVLAQTRALTRQSTVVIRLLLGALDATD